VSDEQVNPPLTEAVRELVVAMLAVRRAVTRRAGITETELRALEYVSEAPSSPGELARLLDVSTAASTGVVDRLEKHGHVVRRPHPTDRRRQEVHLTESGEAEMEHHLRPMLVALAELEAGMTEAERRAVLAFFGGAMDAFASVISAEDQAPFR